MSIEESIASALSAQLEPMRAELRRVTAELEALRRALPPQLVTMTEAAKRLDVSLSTVRRRVKDGELPSRNVGRSVRVDLSALRGPTEREVNAGVVRLRDTMASRRASGET